MLDRHADHYGHIRIFLREMLAKRVESCYTFTQ